MIPQPLLTRNEFRTQVFARDRHLCVVCQGPAKDAHHLLERRLWPDGGYYLDNGCSLCEKHHLEAEQTVLSVEHLRELAGITRALLPPHLYTDQAYDKWGSPILPNGTRLRGELFDDPSVQKILSEGGALGLYTNKVKYPRTFHLPDSPGGTNDDRYLSDYSQFENQKVVVHVKLDGENTTWYRDYMHARSLEYDPHPSRSLVKALHGAKAFELPEGYRLNGENVYAKHSIHYEHLRSYFYAFSMWNDKNECLSWGETREWIELLGLEPCPVLYEGLWDEVLIKNLYRPTWNGDPCEGFVVRNEKSFHYRDFRKNVGKWVRPGHVNTNHHWKAQKVVPNIIKE